MNFALVVKSVKEGKSSLVAEAPRMLAFLDEVDAVPDLTECKAQADAVQAYLSNRKDASVEEYNTAVKIRAKAMHRLGEVLAVTVNHKGGGDPSIPS